MDSCERFDETSLPDKKAFYSELYQEDITDKDITDITDDITITKDITDAHAQNLFKKLKLKSLGDYHDFYVQSNTLLLADVFGNFRNKCIEIYELDPAHFLSAPGLAWQACFKKDWSRIRITN